MFHVELRKFPHGFWRFNLSSDQLQAEILAPWTGGTLVEAGERHWDPRTATLTVLEGPRLEVQELSLGRGWRNAQRRSEDVTARMLAEARAEAAAAEQAVEQAGAERAAPQEVTGRLRGLLGEDAGTLLGEDAEALLELWRSARKRHPQRSPSECLALAEEALRALEDR